MVSALTHTASCRMMYSWTSEQRSKTHITYTTTYVVITRHVEGWDEGKSSHEHAQQAEATEKQRHVVDDPEEQLESCRKFGG